MGEKLKKENYSIGLDIGTSSVGWSVTNESGDLKRFKGKCMLGSSLFESAEVALTRRGFRSSRRRLQRRQVRIENLQNLVQKEMAIIDPLFFMKMKESKLYLEDKSNDPLNLDVLLGKWDGKNGIDRKEFKTIYHLREYIMNAKEKVDFRLIYLALHHALKYRGNFLYQEMETFSAEKGLKASVEEFLEAIQRKEEYGEYEEKDVVEIENILKDKKMKNRDKEIALTEVFMMLINISEKTIKKQKATAFSKAMIGGKANFSKMFSLEEESEISFKLSEDKAETELDGKLDDDNENIYLSLKNIYSAYILTEILKGETTISRAMIAKYNEHRDDLKSLKKLLKEYFNIKIYNEMFRNEKSNYNLYLKNSKELPQEEFCKNIKKILESKKDILQENEEYKYCLSKIEEGNFLAKTNTTDNGAIPFQLHSYEVQKIIKNQGEYYPTLKESYLTKEGKEINKIISILEFRIPYYVGPLTNIDGNEKDKKNKNTPFSWSERHSDEKIYPWNFNEVINIEKSAENFILRMTNKCTYLQDKDVIPKNSLLYSEFTLLNELNKISIGGKIISSDVKKYVLEELFEEFPSISKKKLQGKLKEHKHPMADSEITGFQKETGFVSSKKSYLDFKKILGVVDKNNYEMIERIILWITLFEDKKILKSRMEKEYPELSIEQVKDICKLKYKGWSRLSKELLVDLKATGNSSKMTAIYSKDIDTVGKNILEIMRATNENFMQIIENKELGFNEAIQKENSDKFKEENKIKYEDVQELAGSPALKKGIWHSIKVIKEIVNIMGNNPSNIYLEVAREDGQKGKRTNSRYNTLKKIYEKIEFDIDEFTQCEKDLKSYEKNQKALDSERLYLYFIQNGKCMYTGKPLTGDLSWGYDVDHILPQSYIKDDSFDNKVLVYSGTNRRKSDSLLLEDDVIQKNILMWNKLLKSGLMTPSKYKRLTRKKISEEEVGKFIARQLVETRQIIKNVVTLLQVEFATEETQIHLVKSNLISNFREKYELYKNRNLNDFHHAHDAYFLCVLGSFVQTCYPNIFKKEFKYEGYLRDFRDSVKVDKERKNKYGWLISKFGEEEIINQETGEIVKWLGKEKIGKIKKIMDYRDVFVAKKVEEQTGEFYNQTLYSPNSDKKNLIPQKRSYFKDGRLNEELDPLKYGGYSGVNPSYYCIVEYLKKKKITRELIGIPTVVSKDSNKDAIRNFLKKETNSDEIKVLVKKINKYQKISYEGNLWSIVSSGEVINARQLYLNYSEQLMLSEIKGKTLKNSEKSLEEKKEKRNEMALKLYCILMFKIKEEFPCFKNTLKKLEEAQIEFEKLPLEDKITHVDKVNFIDEVLKVLSASSTNGNFKKFSAVSKLGDREGRMGSKTLTPDKIGFINTSITGMREKKMTLKDLGL
ncbi:MAG: type II CRISPR RNA-guided endonuclease Cas9 [Fusobacteriaceae bacterium]